MDVDICRFSGVLTSVMDTGLLIRVLHSSCKLWNNRLINVNYSEDSGAVVILTYCVYRVDCGR
jgi:hypothetical protein